MTKASKLPTNTLEHMNRSVLPALMKHRYSWPFMKAVDFIALKIPDYPKIIRQPMDFTKVREKLRTKQYTCVNDCVTDIDTIFSNCYLFNQPGEDVVYMAMQLHAILKDKLRNVPGLAVTPMVEPRITTPNNIIRNVDSASLLLGKRRSEERDKLPHKIARIEPPRTIVEATVLGATDIEKCMYIIKEMMSSKYQKWNTLFLHPVDVKGLNLFDYYDIVKRPMDLTTIKSKLEARLYVTMEKFVDDIELVFGNCIKYNGEGTDLGIIAKKFQEVFREIYAQTLTKMDELHPIIDKPTAIPHKAVTPETMRPTPTKTSSDCPKPTEIPDKKHILDLLTKLQRQQDDLVTKSKKVEELMSVQNSEIEELYQKLIGTDKPEATNAEFCDAGSLMSSMSECVLSSSTSTVSNSRKSKRQIRPPKNQLEDTVDVPQSLSGKKSMSNGTSASSTKKSALDSCKKEAHVNKSVSTAHELSNKIKAEVFEEYKPMTYDDKRKLSIKINQLLSDKLSTVLQIIKDNEVAMQESDPDEMEIDFETLQTKTLRELEKFVDSVMAVSKVPPSVKKSAHMTHNGVSKNKSAVIEYTSTYATENKILSQSRCSSPATSSGCSDSSSSESGLSMT